jgi:two-component system sensor histidine kinase/response regulator
MESKGVERLRILVVDDELGMRLAVCRALEKFSVRVSDIDGEVGFEVDQAVSGEEALEKMKTSFPDILLLDHKLPGLSGLDVLQTLASADHDLLTIMITAYASLETAVLATKRGAYDFLAKPFTPDELKAAVYKAAKHLTLQRQAKKLAQEKRQFRFQTISIVAHELKAPIAAIDGYLSIIKERSAGEDQEIYDHMVDRCLVRLQGMRKLIKDLLDLTRIESGQTKRQLTELDVREVAQSLIESLLPIAAERHITLKLQAARPVSLRADQEEIEIILNNLLSNAIKYNRENGSVEVGMEGRDGKVFLTVVDTGIGMTEGEASRLFSEFVRIKNKNTQNILGSGLGLSIVKKIAHFYDGEVSVKSQPNAGSTFTVVLKNDPPGKDSGEKDSPEEKRSPAAERVLVG